MLELVKYIFSDFWVYTGVVFLIYSVGHSLSMPFYWWLKIRQVKMNKSIWGQSLN